MARFPLVLPAACLVASLLAERAGYALVAVALALALAILAREGRLCASFAAFGVVLGALHGHPTVIGGESRTRAIAGTVIGDVRASTVGSSFPFALAGGPVVRVFLRDHVAIGERLRLRGRVAPIDGPRNPGEIDLQAMEAARGIAGEVTRARLIARDGFAKPSIPIVLARTRAAASERLRRWIPEPEASILAGALYGERGTIPHDLRDDFQATGTVHVLVTAGLHLGIVAATTLFVFRLFCVPRFAACACAIIIVWLYAAISGDHIPSVRAATMISVVLIGRAIGVRAATGNAIAAAVIVIAILLTPDVGTTSFWLSFACVTSIVLFANPIAEEIGRLHVVPHPIAEALALTISTQIGVLPLTLATFFTLAPYAIVANAIVVPLVGIAMVGGWCVLAISSVASLAVAVGSIERGIVEAIVWVVTCVAALPGARMVLAPPPTFATLIDLALAVTGAFFFHRHRPMRAVACIAVGIAIIVVSPRSAPLPSAAITMIDVGQGDAILVRSTRGRAVLIDTGGRLERGTTDDGNSPAEAIGERIVVPTLLRLGITRLDAIVLTHPHGDHAGGLAPILRTLSVGRIFDSGQRYGGHAFNDALQEAAKRNVQVEIARCGDALRIDDIVISILSPCTLAIGGKNDINENSVVALVQIGAVRALFMGDAGLETERRLLARSLDLHAHILKIGHHGSAYATSPAFLAAVNPSVALISVGRHNLFGHPAQATLRHLQVRGIWIYRTDRCGAIQIAVTPDMLPWTQLPCSLPPPLTAANAPDNVPIQ